MATGSKSDGLSDLQPNGRMQTNKIKLLRNILAWIRRTYYKFID